MDMTINSHLNAIAEKAPQVAQLAAAREAAVAAERDMEAAIFERAIELIRPALSAVVARIPIAFREQVGSPRPAEFTYSQTYRGLLLVDGYGRDSSDIEGGRFFGERLYLLEDGGLLSLRREGHWTEEEDGTNGWEVVEERAISLRESMDEYALAECLEPMFQALERPARTLVEPIRKTQERTERLRAILTLI